MKMVRLALGVRKRPGLNHARNFLYPDGLACFPVPGARAREK